jgi:hypothetical protein
MRILSPIVLPSSALMQVLDAEIAGRWGGMTASRRSPTARDEGISLQKLTHQFKSCVPVALGLDQDFENLALGVDGAPQVDHPPIDFQIDLVQMPSWPDRP